VDRPAKIPESVLVVIHTAARDVLLLERADHPGYWQSVTGAKDTLDEPLAVTAAREVREETGIEIGSPRVPREHLRDWGMSNVYEIYPVWRHRYAAGVTHVVLNPREHLRHRWLPWREAADCCFSPSNAEAILQLPRFAQSPAP
jgi:dATP pyrophosphohydrolase